MASFGANKIFANSGFLVFERVFNMGLSFIVSIYVIRYLGPEDYGLWQYSVSLVALFLPLGRIGTTHLVIKDLVLNGNKIDSGKILGTSLVLILGAGFLLSVVVSTLGYRLETDKVIRVLIIIASTELVFQGFEVFDYYFQSKVLSKYAVFARTASMVGSSLLKVLFVLFKFGVIFIGLSVLLGGIVRCSIYLFRYLRSEKTFVHWRFDAKYAKGLIRNSWPLMISGLSLAIFMKIDQVMLRNMVDTSAVGNYAVAVRLSELWYFIPMAIISSVFPSIIRIKIENHTKYYNRLQQLYDLMAILALAIAVIMTFASNVLVVALYGEVFSSAGQVLSVHVWAGIFVFLGVVRSKWIVNENYQVYGMTFNIIGAFVNVGLNFLFIPKYGILGAAWATLISQALSASVLALLFKKTRLMFFMHFKSIINALMLYPAYRSLKEMYKEYVK